MAISLLELRHIIESAFLPLECRCTSNAANKLTVQIFDRTTGSNLVVSGIDVASLNTSRAIAELMGQLRSEMTAVGTSVAQPHVRQAGRSA